jgi:peroxin-11B
MTVSDRVNDLIFHPKVSNSLRVLATTVGRDKLYRAIQYFSRFYAYILIRNGFNTHGHRWAALKSAMAMGRKLLRLFKPFEHLQLAMNSAHVSNGHKFEKWTAVARQLSYAGYITFDGIVWANGVRFLTLDPVHTVRANLISQRFWLAGIILSIANGIVKINRHASSMKELRRANTSEKADVPEDVAYELQALSRDHSAIRYQLAMDVFDFWLPASNLGYVHVNEGLCGIFGFISSVMALRLQWAAAAGKKV